MAKAKWGTKRTCPKCGARFYDLGKEKPVVCIECENEWIPEPILKSRQPELEEPKKKKKEKKDDDETVIDDDELEKIEDTGEGDAIEEDLDDDDSDVSDVIKKPKGDDED